MMQDKCEVVRGVSAKSQFCRKLIWAIVWHFSDDVLSER